LPTPVESHINSSELRWRRRHVSRWQSILKGGADPVADDRMPWEAVMGTEDAVCRICDRPILPGEGLVKVAHDVMHVACLPSTKRRAEEHGKAS